MKQKEKKTTYWSVTFAHYTHFPYLSSQRRIQRRNGRKNKLWKTIDLKLNQSSRVVHRTKVNSRYMNEVRKGIQDFQGDRFC